VAAFSPDNQIDRRAFLKATGVCVGCSFLEFGPSFGILDAPNEAEAGTSPTAEGKPHEAQFYKKLEGLEIECELCPRKCAVGDRERGFCGVRENNNGIYHTLVYGNPCSANVDPIEKKPFFHYLPGTLAFSIATAGCNLNCKFCQNWEISQFRPEQIRSMKISASEVAGLATRYGCPTIAYTYSEPTVFYEYMLDSAIEGKKKDIRSVVITAGYIQPEPMEKLIPLLAAVKVDLKAFTQKYYADICNGELQPVLDTLALLKKTGIWFEIVYLMLPTLNDKSEEIKLLCDWMTANLGPDVPIHFTRFHPEYLLKNLPSTPVESLEAAYEIAQQAGLNFPYIGNVYGHKGENTFCPRCKSQIITRQGFEIRDFLIQNGCCQKCGQPIPGVWA
jgi:pyruvate formate lyase activating enzyme